MIDTKTVNKHSLSAISSHHEIILSLYSHANVYDAYLCTLGLSQALSPVMQTYVAAAGIPGMGRASYRYTEV